MTAMYSSGKMDFNAVKSKLIKSELVIEEDGILIFTDKGFRAASSFVGDANEEHITSKRISKLAETMAELYPTGKKSGTSQYWRGNSKIVSKKLTKFLKENRRFGEIEILDATSRYIKSFNCDYKLMRILPYFIEKDGVSDLLSLLENTDEQQPQCSMEEFI